MFFCELVKVISYLSLVHLLCVRKKVEIALAQSKEL